MSLNLEQVALPIHELAQKIKVEEKDITRRLEKAVDVSSAIELPELAKLKRRIEESRARVRWNAAGLYEFICRAYPLPESPHNFIVLAVDGSYIEIDRHRAVQCYLINLGQVRLNYGDRPGAYLSSNPFLYGYDANSMEEDTEGINEEFINSEWLSARCSVEECKLLTKTIEELAGDEPVLSLLDGSLILWGLGVQDTARRQELLQKRLLPALDKIKSVSNRRQLILASYISAPRSNEVINAIRIIFCQHEIPDCNQYCFSKESAQECQVVSGLSDKDFFGRILSPGERSPLFRSHASLVSNYYGEHQIAFFYLNVGEEIARVEIPVWIAEQSSLLELTHALTYDQCQRGLGYPVALSEAHQQAVVTTADRDNFWRLVDRALVSASLPNKESAKSWSKITRWL